MSKRKRDRLDTGRTDEHKKSKSNRKNVRGATTLTEKHESSAGAQAQDGTLSAAAIDKGDQTVPIKTSRKLKHTSTKNDSDDPSSNIQKAPPTESLAETLAVAPNVSVVHEKPGQKVVKREKRGKIKNTRTKAREKAEAVPRQGKRNRQEGRTSSQNTRPLWQISDAIGGQMIDLDPIFALNEEYLLIAYDAAIHVYSTSTSLLVRRLVVRKLGKVTGFALSPSQPNHIYLSTNVGSIEKWNWVEGKRLGCWHNSTPIHHLATSSLSSDEASNDLVYTVDRKGQTQWMLTVHRLLEGDEAPKTDLGTLMKYPSPLTSVKILMNGKIIILTCGSQLIVGYSDKPDSSSLKDVAYVWREIECPEWISSVDVQTRPYQTTIMEADGRNLGLDSALDVAVGTLRGPIVIYDDLLNNLVRNETSSKTENRRGLSSQKLHWHRTAVLALKWSKDAGNYVISGGLETVLVLWQLETGKKQVLPHLSTSIESIVVSPSGSSYCIRLADNSNMILSTSELKPTFNISGIQVTADKRTGLFLPFIPTVDAPTQESVPKEILRCPVILNPVLTGRLLAAVPTSAASRLISGARQAACYLQTFDIDSAQQTSKQSLTRTKVTTLNMGPEANTIEEPSVLYMQISHDGQWLATVDEWLPPRRDVSSMAVTTEKVAEEQSKRRETYLKFWQWNDTDRTWELFSRVDDPHSSPSNIRHDANKVLELKTDPSLIGFATMGNESMVKFWRPSGRRRHGREVRDNHGRPMSNWNCHYMASLESSQTSTATDKQGAKLVYSRDGSVLAAGYRFSSPSTISLIDSHNGTVRRTLCGLHRGPLLGLGILDRYLIILSNELRVWDMVTEQHTFGFVLQNSGLKMPSLSSSTHLAIDSNEETFAISLPEISQSARSGKPKSQIIIFSPKSPAPLFSTSIANSTHALLPAPGRKGSYYILDSAAEIRTLTPTLSSISSTSQQQRQPQQLDPLKKSKKQPQGPKGLENIYGNGTTSATTTTTAILKTDEADNNEQEGNDDEEEEASPLKTKTSSKNQTITASPTSPLLLLLPKLERPDAVVVTSDALAKVFDTKGSPFTLPPMTELYEQIARLCVGKGGV